MSRSVPDRRRGYIRFRKYLCGDAEPAVVPRGVSLAGFGPVLHARDLHALFRAAYAGGGGRVDAFDTWWPALRDDPEYDSALVFLALDDAGRMIGGAQCWTSAFVKDLAVAEVWRGKGVGKALLMNAFACFRLRRAAFLDLKAEADHPSGAAGFYRRLGMVELA